MASRSSKKKSINSNSVINKLLTNFLKTYPGKVILYSAVFVLSLVIMVIVTKNKPDSFFTLSGIILLIVIVTGVISNFYIINKK